MDGTSTGLYSTAGELGTFARMMLNRGTVDGKPYLSKESWNALTLKYGIDYVLLDLRLVEPDLPLERVFSAGDWAVLRTQNTP